MTENNASIFEARVSDAAEFERLEDGVYNGVCVGVVAREFADYNNPEQNVTKMQFIFQVAEDGQTYYFRSKPCKVLLGEKSNLFILVNGWTGASLEKMSEGFTCASMVGYGAQLVINTAVGKDNKSYANLANVLKLKKGVKVAVTPDAIPAYLVKDNVGMVLADGITVKAETEKPATPPAQPFGGAKKGANPGVPANAAITQNANAAAFMGAQPQQNTVPPAADDDDDDTLPF